MIIRLEMKNHNMILTASALSSKKIGKIGNIGLTGEKILPYNQRQIIKQAKFTYFPLGKAFKKQVKAIQDQGKNKLSL